MNSRAKTPSRLLLTVAFAISAMLLGIIGAVAAGTGTVTPPPKIAFVASNVTGSPDALTVGPMAGRLGAPLFITNKESLGESTKDALVAYGADLIIVAGGSGSITNDVLAEISTATGKAIKDIADTPSDGIVRVFGTGRDQTAAELAKLLDAYNPKFLPTDATAADSDLLDGKDSTAFLGKTEKAADADKLDGMDSTAFVMLEDGFAPQSIHVSDGPNASNSTVEVTKLSISPGDPCGGGTTAHSYLATFTGTGRNMGTGDSWMGTRIVKDGESLSVASFGSGPGTISTSHVQTGGFAFANMGGTRLFTDIAPGAQDIRVLFQEANGESSDVIWATLNLIYLGYTCP